MYKYNGSIGKHSQTSEEKREPKVISGGAHAKSWCIKDVVRYETREVSGGQIIKALVEHVPWEASTLGSGHIWIWIL